MDKSDRGVHLTNVAESAGLRFVYQHSPTPEKYFVESVPGGVAVFDYNGDGRPDIFFTNGAKTPALDKVSPIYSNRLYRNDGGMRFTDVTSAAGLSGTGYAIGAAAGDFDNDGHVDLFVAGVRTNQLYRNRGDGRFEDVTKAAGIASGDFAVGGGWFDYDNDGRLDLLVVNYVQWSADKNPACGDEARRINIYCHPRVFQGLPNRLYRNRGDRTFEDVSARAGLQAHIGKGMSVAFADFDHDGRLDIFVTNDAVPNFLFRNNGDGTFTENALAAGVSVPDTGRPTSSMGVDAQDYDNDGWEDIHFTALTGETFPLFRNESARNRGTFVEVTQQSGLAAPTVKSSGWCSIVADVDNDGWKDIFTANSHVNDRIGDFEALEFRQPNSLFVNDGRGRFRDATTEAGLGDHDSRAPRLRHRRLQRRRPSRHRRRVARVAGGAVAERQRAGIAVADRAAGRHEEQPRRHRRTGHRRKPGADDDHGDGLRVVFTCGAAFRVGRTGRASTGRGAVAFRNQTDHRQRRG